MALGNEIERAIWHIEIQVIPIPAMKPTEEVDVWLITTRHF